MPSWLLRLAALAVPLVRQIAPELGKIKNATNEKARRVLGWTPRSNEECIIAAAQSLMRYGLLKDGIQHAAIQPPDPDRTIASGQTRT
jgi:hypothetical protein